MQKVGYPLPGFFYWTVFILYGTVYIDFFVQFVQGEAMVYFQSADVPAVRHCGTAQMLQGELIRLRNLKLPELRGVEVVVRYRIDAHGNDTFVLTFSNGEMNELKKRVVREIIQGDAFSQWLLSALGSRHGWGGLRTRVTSREKNREYVWSVEKTA